ncbi:MAG: orotidine-5'-phosphate decarboxylase [Verrucomicrobia bacterium]|nr:orotidine-5'-phosphate decarboxylase [Verrucomicrobiota bacterium]
MPSSTKTSRRTAQLIVAVDIPNPNDVAPLIDSLPPEVTFYKIGLELFVAGGPAILETLAARGKKIFLDLKLHDIPRTVEAAVRSACQYPIALLTVHTQGGRAMLTAAAEAARAAGPNAPKVIGVTMLTSLDQRDLIDLGIPRSLDDQTLALAQLGIDAGLDGLVCSPLEVKRMRQTLGPNPVLVTPGIRPRDAAAGDQKRIATPTDAVRAGSSYVVVGRPILQAKDPAAAAQTILDEIAAA